jgi:hypothetical protein
MFYNTSLWNVENVSDFLHALIIFSHTSAINLHTKTKLHGLSPQANYTDINLHTEGQKQSNQGTHCEYNTQEG